MISEGSTSPTGGDLVDGLPPAPSYSNSPGQIVRQQMHEVIRSKVSLQTCFSKISRDPTVRSLFYHDLKLFQGEARWMIHARGSGKIGLASIFSFKHWCMPSKMTCRVVRTLSTYSKSNILAEAGAIERQLCIRLFINFCHKNNDISFDFPEISMRVVVHEDMYYNFMHAKREVWEKSVARERAHPRFHIFLKNFRHVRKNVEKSLFFQVLLVRRHALFEHTHDDITCWIATARQDCHLFNVEH